MLRAPWLALALFAFAAVGARAPDPVWLKGDLHVHTTHSHDVCDASDPLSETCLGAPYSLGFTPAGQIRNAEMRGLDFVALTDHGTVAQQSDPGFASDTVLLLPSYEHSLARGHAGLHGVRARLNADTRTADGAEALVAEVHARGGLVVLNHPASTGSSWEYERDVAGVDAVEMWNAPWRYDDPLPGASNNAGSLAFYEAMLSRGVFVPVVGGSDSHWVATSAVQGVGEPTTHVLAAERSVAGVLDGIRAGHTFVTAGFAGPELRVEAVGAARGIMGDVLPADGSAYELRVRVLGGVGLEVLLDTRAGRASLGLATGADATLATSIVADAGAWALVLLADPALGEVVAVASPVAFA